MSSVEVEARFHPLPPQKAFQQSGAKVRGYGGAMGGGKSRALCEEVFDWLLDFPGIEVPIFRQKHTSLESTTRKTFFEQVLPQELLPYCKVVSSQGRDFCKLWNGSIVHFAGLDDPGKWFSSEIGAAAFDEAHEIEEKDVLTINTRLRQRCQKCVRAGKAACPHMPRKLILTFNPADPGHWLQQWFLLGGSKTEFGFYKPELFPSEATSPIGDAEFFFAKAAENPYLAPDYIDLNLAGLPEHLRRRYLEGHWEYISGKSFFDTDALLKYQQEIMASDAPMLVGETEGNPKGGGIRVRSRRNGQLIVWEPPKREVFDEETGKTVPPNRYIVSVDTSSGGSKDYSALQVVCIEDFSQVAEWQGKLDPDLVAVEAFRLACVYNGALIAPEITGGWGFSVVKRLQALIHEYRGGVQSKPRLYTRKVLDRLSDKWTDRLGWDTTVKTRFHMLDTLERVLREREFLLRGERTLAELGAFVFPDKKLQDVDYKSPRAQPGANDDLVVALAIAVTVMIEHPRQVKRLRKQEYKPQFSLTGY